MDHTSVTKMPHRHTLVEKAALAQRHGVPVQVVRCICSSCRAVLDERTVRRIAA